MVTALLILHTSTGAKILGIFPFHARSHTFVSTALMLELAKRGHEVTVLTHNPQKEKLSNYTEIVVKTSLKDLIGGKGMSSYAISNHRRWEVI
jgi:UDP:flavonoid glycosyltransferase YjiC (YdhE family)